MSRLFKAKFRRWRVLYKAPKPYYPATGDPALRTAFHAFKERLVTKIEAKNADFKATLENSTSPAG